MIGWYCHRFETVSLPSRGSFNCVRERSKTVVQNNHQRWPRKPSPWTAVGWLREKSVLAKRCGVYRESPKASPKLAIVVRLIETKEFSSLASSCLLDRIGLEKGLGYVVDLLLFGSTLREDISGNTGSK